MSDVNNCVATACITLTDPAYFEVLLDSVNHVICHGGNEGNIGVTVYGGSSPYTYAWQKDGGIVFATTEDLENLENGGYLLIVTDANQCTAPLNVDVFEPPPLTILGQVERVSCNGFCDGKVNAIPAGGTPGTIAVEGWTYQYRLDTTTFGDYTPWQVDSFFYGLCPGFYSLEVIDANGCISAYPDFEIWEPPLLEVTFVSQTNVSCNGGANGSVDVSITGGTLPYDISWSNGANTEDISGLAAGTYSVTVIDDSDCEAFYTVTITEPSELLVSVTSTDVTCCNYADGTVDLTVSGGVMPYTYSWDNGAATQDLSNLGPGVYCVTVTDFNGCTATICSNQITEPPCLDATYTKVDIDCYGNGNGSIDVTVTGGTMPYTYSWLSGEVVEDLTSLGPGNYCLTVTDANGCTDNLCVDIYEPPLLQISTTHLDITCCGFNNGSIDLTISGGSAPISILWSNQEISEDLFNLGPGQYCVTVTDDNNCVVETCVTITEPLCLDLMLDATPITCNAYNDGSIDATISGGVLPYTYAWSNGANVEDIYSLAAGNYCLTVTDFNGCVVSACTDILEPDQLTLTETHIDVDCFGNNNGSIDLTIAGGNLPYSINWNNGSQMEDLANLGPGTYCVTVIDAKGCSGNLCVTIDEPTLLEAVVTSYNDVTCYGYNDGNIDVTISGGTLPYTILWNNGAFTEDLNNIGPGNYCLTVTDANGCFVTLCQQITEPDIFVVNLDVKVDVSCYGFSDGSIDVYVFGGVQPYTYLWSTGAVTEDISGLAAGTYYLTVTDFNNCEAYISVDVNQPDVLALSETHVDVLCYGNQTGSVDLTVVGGTMPYAYLWNNGAMTEDLTGLAAGTYSVTVTDAQGCTDNLSVTITEPTLLEAVVTTYGDVSCYGFDDGSVDVTVTGGAMPYTYLWNNGANTEDLTNVGPGTYCLTVTDANQCVVSLCQTVLEPTMLNVSLYMKIDVSCYGLSDGSIDVMVSGGTMPYTYLWDNGAITEDIANLAFGTYCVTVTDFNGCVASLCIDINQPDDLVVSLVSKVDVDCYGNNNGAIDIDVVGGTAPYSYLWNNGAITQDLSGIGPGTYCVTVTDAQGCTDDICVDIYEPADLALNLDGSGNITCYMDNDGYVNVTASGGVLPYTYLWNNGATTEDLANLGPGTYCLTVTDANQCIETLTCVTLTEPDILEAIVVSYDDVTCFGFANGSADVSVFGGTLPYTYSWSYGANTEDISNLGPGTYNLTVVDANGCMAYADVTITEPTLLELVGSDTDISCYGFNDGEIDITASGGTMPYTYLWNDGVTTEDRLNLAPGTYSVTVTDANQCTVTGSWVITQPALLEIVNPVITDASIFGASDGSIDITVTGGTPPYSYIWSNGATTEDIAGLPAGTYSVTVTDSHYCYTIGTWIIDEPDDQEISITTTDIPCYNMDNGTIDLTIWGGTPPYTIVWNYNGSFYSNLEDLTHLDSGTYEVTVTDSHGDFATGTAIIYEPTELLLSETHVDILCHGDMTGSIDLTVNGGTAPYSYTWSNGAITEDLFGLAAGTYDVTVVDAQQCIAYLSATIVQPDLLVATIAGKVDVSCYGGSDGSIDLTVTGGTLPYTYSWSNGAVTEDISGLPMGTYMVTITDANGCLAYASEYIFEPSPLDLIIYGYTNVDCYGNANGTIDIMVTGGTMPYTYLWSNGAVTEDISGLGPNNYCVTVTDALGCVISICQQITEPTELLASATYTDVTCYGFADGTIDLTVTGGTTPYAYSWDNGAMTEDLSGLAPGTYCVTVTDANGCVISLCETITQPDALAITGIVAHPLCYGDMNGSIDISVTGGTLPYTYTWSNFEVSEDLLNLGHGTYCVTVTDANGCMIEECFTLIQPDELMVDITTIVHVDCYGNGNGSIDISVYGGTQAYTFAWSDGKVSEDIANLGPGTYTVTVTDANGCTATNYAEVIEPPLLTLTGSVTNIICYGQQSGAIDITVAGGVMPYTYSWDNGSMMEDLSGLLAGTYCVTVTDYNGCVVTDCYIIDEPPLLELALDVHDLLCVDGNEGWIDMTITGGVAPYDIIWSNGETTKDIDTLMVGTYCVTVTDAYGCVATICGTVDQPPYPLAALYITGENVDCYGADNGWFQVMGTGGAAPYQYSLDYGPFTAFMDTPMTYYNLTPGFHLLTIGDSNNCEVLYEIEITEPDPLELTFNWENIYCNGESTGWIDMTITGGTLYQYLQTCNCDTMCHSILWSNGATTEDISGLTAGNYTVTVTDCNGCIATGSITITEPPVLVLTYTKMDLNCYGDATGEIDLTVTGGTPPYSYQWNNGATTEDLTGLSGGFYSVTVTDANNCVAMITVMITEPAPTQLDFDVTNIMCTGVNDGAIDLLLQDSICLIYTWSNGATTQDIDNLAPGWYWVTVVDCNGCIAIDSACVYAPNNELEIGYTVHDVLCYGGNTGWIEIDAIGGTMPYVGIKWTGVVPTECCGLDTIVLDSVQLWGLGQTSDVIENLQAGTYYVTLTDAYGCEAYEVIVVGQPQCPVNIANYLVTDVDMGIMGEIDIYVCCGTFPYTYYWEYEGDYFANTEDLEYLQSGVYTVTVTDANGCMTYGSFVVDSNVYPPWTSGISESSHTIYVPVGAVPSLTIGDYIGVFYDSLGTFACGGFVKWEGVATTIAAWGDDGIDPSDETGFVDGEEFSWVIWDAGTGIEYAANPTYDLGPSWPSDSTYEVNGISGLLALAIGNILDAQDIDLMAGWNLISTYIDPFQDGVEFVFAPVLSELVIVKNGDGQVYWPTYSVNVIGNMAIGEGYKVKMNSAQTLTVSGAVIAPESTPIYIPSEWSILGYLRTSPASIETLLNGIVSDVIIVKNESGYVYWPSMFNINTIGNMVPGEGYHIKMSNGATLTYAANGMMTKSGVSNIDTWYFEKPVNTGSNMTIGIPSYAWSSNPQIGDEVAILNNSGEILGASVYTGSAMSITAWGDDAITNLTEGITNGETFSISLWSKATDKVQTLVVDSWEQGSSTYSEDAISVVSKFAETTIDGMGFALHQNVPNPFSTTTQISFQIPHDTYVHIGVYDILGELIEEIVSAELQAGNHAVDFDANKLAVGTYMYKIITDDYAATKQMNVTR